MTSTGFVTNIQRCSTEDGPGIRTSVFFKGCPMKCIWCHNIETIDAEPRLVWYAVKCIGDQGFRGIAEVKGVKISIPKPGSKKASKYQKRKIREKFRKRAGIEPIIGHLKSDFRLKRNYLSGVNGDHHNLIMSAVGFNIRKWMRRYLKHIKNWLNFIWKCVTENYCLRLNVRTF